MGNERSSRSLAGLTLQFLQSMTKDEKDILLEELQLLKELLDIHLQNPHFWVDDQKGFEEYANAVLDRLNEIRYMLNEPPSL